MQKASDRWGDHIVRATTLDAHQRDHNKLIGNAYQTIDYLNIQLSHQDSAIVDTSIQVVKDVAYFRE